MKHHFDTVTAATNTAPGSHAEVATTSNCTIEYLIIEIYDKAVLSPDAATHDGKGDLGDAVCFIATRSTTT